MPLKWGKFLRTVYEEVPPFLEDAASSYRVFIGLFNHMVINTFHRCLLKRGLFSSEKSLTLGFNNPGYSRSRPEDMEAEAKRAAPAAEQQAFVPPNLLTNG